MRCKFIVVEKSEFQTHRQTPNKAYVPAVGAKIKLAAVYESKPGIDGQACEENKIFGDATPSGAIEFTILNEDAAAELKTGKSYYVDFTPAD